MDILSNLFWGGVNGLIEYLSAHVITCLVPALFIAGAMGTLFGSVGSFWKYVIPPVAILLGLKLFGVFKFNISISERYLPKNRALLGAFLMGIAPCLCSGALGAGGRSRHIRRFCAADNTVPGYC
jgi:hypothetical protein